MDQKKSPLVTILMPVFNAEKYLRFAIESILNQTYQNFEFLIIDDGSSDNTTLIISKYSDPRIILIKTKTRIGLSKSLNYGASLSKGKYIARMDADDISCHDRIEKQVKYLETHYSIGVVAGFVSNIDENNNDCDIWKTDRLIKNEYQIKKRLPRENCIAHPTVVFRKEVLLSHPYLNVDGAEDYELWLRLCNNGVRIEKIPEVVLFYRIHNQSVTSKSCCLVDLYKKDSFARTTMIKQAIKERTYSTFFIWVIINEFLKRSIYLIETRRDNGT